MSNAKTKKTSLWIKADGTQEEVFPTGAKWTLSEMQAKVGGYIERIGGTMLSKGQLMLVNEEGLVKKLPPNQKASLMAARPIVGDVLVVPAERES